MVYRHGRQPHGPGWSARPRLGGATPPRRSHPQSAPSLPSSRPTNSPMPNGAGSLRCSPATGSSILRGCRSTLSCSTRASICVRCPRCTGCWDSTAGRRTPPAGAAPSQVCPELVATAPQQVYSWDITKLAGPVKGTYFDAYVMIDIYSRYLVGVHVHAHESGVLARELMEQIFRVHGVPQVVHADRGTSMTSKTVATLLADLEVTRSHSRPRVSNDNPYSESLFKTLKYGPAFPERFGSIWEARQFMNIFTHWYNHEHRHTGIGLHTPADVHFGLATDKAADRRTVLTQARARHPHRFGTVGAPKILDLPDTAWINRPAQNTTQETATTAA